MSLPEAPPLRVLSLFAGIGGIDLGLERTGGFETTAFVEVDPFCQAVLKKHWPDVPIHSDVREFHAEEGEFDCIVGGFPCQPVSVAGKRRGQDDARWLWPEFARIVGKACPPWVLAENVPGLASRGLGDVLASLASLGFDAEWDVVSAASQSAPHLRERIFVVAYPERQSLRVESRRSGGPDGEGAALAGLDGEARPLADAQGVGLRAGTALEAPSLFARQPQQTDGASGRDWAAEPDVGRVAHGVPARVDRLRSLGNAVVPQVAEFVGRLILEAHRAQVAA